MQRDCFSTYLARFVRDDTLQVAKASEAWPGAEPLLRTTLGSPRRGTAWWQATQNQPASRGPRPSSFGRYPSGSSQSGSSEKEFLPGSNTADAGTQAPVEGAERAKA